MASEVEDPLRLLQSCGSIVEARCLQSMLGSEGIEAFIHGEQHRAQLGTMGSYIDLRIMVRLSDLDDALEMIEEAEYAEHLPLDDAEQPVEDPSVRRWRERAERPSDDDDVRDEPAPSRPRSVVVPILLGVGIGFGTGHMFAGCWNKAMMLAMAQIFLVGLAFKDWPLALALSIVMRAIDLVGAFISVSGENRRMTGGPP